MKTCECEKTISAGWIEIVSCYSYYEYHNSQLLDFYCWKWSLNPWREACDSPAIPILRWVNATPGLTRQEEPESLALLVKRDSQECRMLPLGCLGFPFSCLACSKHWPWRVLNSVRFPWGIAWSPNAWQADSCCPLGCHGCLASEPVLQSQKQIWSLFRLAELKTTRLLCMT